jgi:hypothetical protein
MTDTRLTRGHRWRKTLGSSYGVSRDRKASAGVPRPLRMRSMVPYCALIPKALIAWMFRVAQTLITVATRTSKCIAFSSYRDKSRSASGSKTAVS